MNSKMNKIDYIQSVVNGKPIKRNGKAHRTLIAKGLMTLEAEPKDDVPVAHAVEKDDVKELVSQTSKNALTVFKKIRSGEITIPDNLNDDEQLGNYLQQSLMLEMIKNKPKKPKKAQKKKKLYVSSSDESGESESD